MKRLKDTTVNKYTNKQLVNHLDRLLSLFPVAPFRICENLIFKLEENEYYFSFSDLDRDQIIDSINTVYLKLNM